MSGRFYTRGTANLPVLEGSRPCPGISHGNADHNWCRRAGPTGLLGYRTICNLHHLQLWGKTSEWSVNCILEIQVDLHIKLKSNSRSISVYPCRTFVNSQIMVFWAEKRETSDILKGPSCPCAGVMVELSTSFSTALNGCSKALTVCTVLQREIAKVIANIFLS